MYDVIVVGARCAGASLAMLLARQGLRVAMIDRAPIPSDRRLSTHLLFNSGTARLERWGLLDDLAATNCPPLETLNFDLGSFRLTGRPTGARTHAYCARRLVLDGLLAMAASQAGADLHDRCTLAEVLFDDGTVVGVRARRANGTTFAAKAPITVGADGRTSVVARAVRAPASDTRPALQGTYFAYWADLETEGIELYLRERRGVFAFSTNDGLTIVGINWPVSELAAVRQDVEGTYMRELARLAPGLHEKVRAGRREGRVIGGSVPNFVRRPHGPGWALVGDAGYHRDPFTAQGISDAFRDADLLATAVRDGLGGTQPLPDALAHYERERDAAALPMYEFTCQLAALEPLTDDLVQLFSALRTNQSATNDLAGVFAGTVPVPTFFAPENLARILGSNGVVESAA